MHKGIANILATAPARQEQLAEHLGQWDRTISCRILGFLFALFIFVSKAHAFSVCPEHLAPKRILALMSYHIGQPMEDAFSSGIRESLDSLQDSGYKIELDFEHLDGKRFPIDPLDTIFTPFLVAKYSKHCENALIVADNIALEYALRNRERLFPEIPIVFIGINNFHDSLIAGHSNITGLAEDIDISGTIQLIKQLQPSARNLFIIVDQSETGNRLFREAMILGKSFPELKIQPLSKLDYQDIIDTLKEPRTDAAALHLTFTKDQSGQMMPEGQFLKLLGEQSRIPIYTLWEHYVKDGIIGGSLLSGNLHGKQAILIAKKIIQGHKADSIPIQRKSPKILYVNYLNASHYGIPADLFPKNAVIDDQPYSAWDRYKGLIIGTLLLLTILITMIITLIRSRKDLNRQRIQYRELVEHVQAVIIRLDDKGRILFINKYGENLFGYSLTELKNKYAVGTILPKEDESGTDLQSMMNDLLMNPMSYHELQNENITKAGKRIWLHWFNKAIFDSKHELVSILSLGTDISEKHIQEQERAQYNYTFSHDLRTPLVSISSFLSMLETDLDESDMDAVKQDIYFLRTASNRMGVLVAEMLNYIRAGKQVYRYERIAVNDLIKEVMILTAGILSEKNVKVYMKGNAWILGDRSRLIEAFQHLLENSAKYSNSLNPPLVHIGFEECEGIHCLFFRDNGIGIEPQYLDSIFGLFEKLSHDSDGVGAGLPIVKRIIEAHHGKVWAESKGINQGTTIYMTFGQMEMVS